MKAEQLQNHLAHQGIKWQFNLSRAPWWSGQFERLVGLVKRVLFKGIGRACLLWNELEEVLLDVEVTLNNRPLCYVEDDVQLPILTPSAMMFGQPKLIPDEDLERAIQHLYPMELSCDRQQEDEEEQEEASQMNPCAKEFRPQRRAAIAAADNIRRLARVEAAEY